ncbi:MAG: SIMPL domain-containing protein [Alistipes sp.]|nr:SIMPL domain-containing protein [Alistipes sp.]
MKRIILGVFALLTFFAFTTTDASAQELGQTIPTVSVNGSAQLKVLPDEIYITIKLDESDTKGKVTLEEQRRNMFAALKKAGVDAEKQLAVVDMNSSYYRRKGSLAVTQYELKVATAEAVGKVFEALEKAGIPNVNVTRMAYSKMEELRSEARKAAMVNAQQRARELAEAVGQSVGACYEINDYTTTTQPVVMRSNKLMMASGAALDGATEEVEPNVEFEQIVVSYNVSAKFLLNLK